MNKEEIISEQLGSMYHAKTSGELSVFHRCMDEYAKQQSIEFADWLISEGFYPYEKEVGRWLNISGDLLTWQTQELHNQFNEQQTKDK